MPSVPTRAIAEAVGRGLGLPVASVTPDAADEHFGWLALLFGLDVPASSTRTRQLLPWHPTHPVLTQDLDDCHYVTYG